MLQHMSAWKAVPLCLEGVILWIVLTCASPWRAHGRPHGLLQSLEVLALHREWALSGCGGRSIFPIWPLIKSITWESIFCGQFQLLTVARNNESNCWKTVSTSIFALVAQTMHAMHSRSPRGTHLYENFVDVSTCWSSMPVNTLFAIPHADERAVPRT